MARARPDPRRTGDGRPNFVLGPVPRTRQPVLDSLVGASRRFQVHALLEFDVTEARAQIFDAETRVSWTGFVVATIARAVALHPEVNARKAGNRILTFERVDIGATVERHAAGRTVLDVVTIRNADQKSCAEITEMLHEAKYGSGRSDRQSGLTEQLWRVPGSIRRTAFRLAGTRPRVAASFGPAVGVTSLGMFSSGWGWAIPLAPLAVVVTVGGVMDRPAVHEGRIAARPMLPLTLSFDHAVIDGAPAARIAATLRTFAETASAFENLGTGGGRVVPAGQRQSD